MKTIVSALIALSVLAGVAGTVQAFDAKTFTVTVANVAPTAALANNGPIDEGGSATITFSSPSDPSNADTTAGFHYAYSCTNGDLSGATYAGSGTTFEALAVTGGAGHHRWYTFPELQRDEVVAFRTYDSDRVDDGRPYWTPHSAFRDPDVPLGRPARSSIELRASCLFA